MTSFDNQVHVEEGIPCCSYCEGVLDSVVVNGLHESCHHQLMSELDAWDQQFTNTEEILEIVEV